jgi:poly-beta-1,6-N-acetyl-D-glucosamine synthase
LNPLILEHLFFIALSFQAFYYLVVFTRLYFYRNHPKAFKPPEPVSVIICARNESANLAQNLPAVLEQNYPDFEVVVVNDASEDNSSDILEALGKRYPHLKVVFISSDEKITRGKKQALSVGIREAQHELLLLTDADCSPASKNWISEMTSGLSANQQLILGLGPYRTGHHLLDTLVAFETATTAQQYLSYALWDMPYMGVGRNMAYTKTLFSKAGGLSGHFHLPSGDDDLLVQQATFMTETGICATPESLTYSDGPRDWASWYRQKTRHYSTGKYYRPAHRFFLGTFLASKALIFPTWLAAMVFSFHPGLVIAITLYWAIVAASMLHLKLISGIPVPWLLTPVLDPLYAGSAVVLGLFSTFKKSEHWK